MNPLDFARALAACARGSLDARRALRVYAARVRALDYPPDETKIASTPKLDCLQASDQK